MDDLTAIARLEAAGWSRNDLGGGTCMWVLPVDPDEQGRATTGWWQLGDADIDLVSLPRDYSNVALGYYDGAEDECGTWETGITTERALEIVAAGPPTLLDRAQRALDKNDLDDCAFALFEYARRRGDGLAEPEGGDARAAEIHDALDAAHGLRAESLYNDPDAEKE